MDLTKHSRDTENTVKKESVSSAGSDTVTSSDNPTTTVPSTSTGSTDVTDAVKTEVKPESVNIVGSSTMTDNNADADVVVDTVAKEEKIYAETAEVVSTCYSGEVTMDTTDAGFVATVDEASLPPLHVTSPEPQVSECVWVHICSQLAPLGVKMPPCAHAWLWPRKKLQSKLNTCLIDHLPEKSIAGPVKYPARQTLYMELHSNQFGLTLAWT